MATEQQTNSGSDESAEPSTNSAKDLHKFWDKELRAFNKRADKFQKNGNIVVDRYRDEDTKQLAGTNDFRINLFWKTVKTLKAMLYGSTPKIEVKREFGDPDDDVARVAAVILKRMLSANTAPSGDGLAPVLRQSLEDRLLPGCGVARVVYEVEVEQGEDGQEKLAYEGCKEQYVHWQDFAWGWARTWELIPWVGFRSFLTKEQVEKRFGEKIASSLSYQKQKVSESKDSISDPDQDDNIAKAEIWEFWHKDDQKVYWYCKDSPLILDEKEDPLNLDGFWPCPKPMFSNLSTREVMPKADYLMAQDLYNKVDTLETRINMITKAIKVVGVYDQGSTGIKRMMEEGFENDLIPVDNWAAFADKGGIQGQIDWLPIDQVAGVLQQLRQELGATMNTLYEVTGLSDIMRGGNTDQYTSDGTNQLKAKFGSIEVQTLQDEFARFASDLEELKAEVISKHYSPETIYKNSSAQFLPQADQMLIGPAIELISSPTLKWRIDIKPESIAMVDYAQLKSERTEYLTSVATFLQSAAGLVQSVPGSLPVLLEMLKWGMAGFKGSDYLEGTLDKAIEMAAKQPPPGQDDGKAQAEQQKMQLEIQKIQTQLQADMQVIQAKSQADVQIAQVKAQVDLQHEMADHQNAMQEVAAKSHADMMRIIESLKADLQVLQAKVQVEEAKEVSQAQNNSAEEQVTFEHDLEKQFVQHELDLQRIQEEAVNAEMEARLKNRGADKN